MLHKINLVKTAKLSGQSKTTVKFDENLEFDVVFKCINGKSWFQIKNVKGDLKITRITTPIFIPGITSFFAHFGEIIDVAYDELKNTFVGTSAINLNYTFYITANKEMKEKNIEKYLLRFLSEGIRLLKPNEFIKRQIFLPVHIENPYDIEIHVKYPYDTKIETKGKRGDFKIRQCSTKDIDLNLRFVYDPLITMNPLQPLVKTNEQETLISESRPQSTLPSESKKEVNSYWYKILSNERFADIFFISSNNETIPSHRCILYEVSPIFAKIIDETSELPVTINFEDFDAETIKSALDFLYGTNDSSKGKENEIFKFAVKYNIKKIMDACCSYFEESVNPSNVCELIQIAYSNNFEKLKLKCLKILVEKKKEIDPPKFADLPKSILIDAFCL